MNSNRRHFFARLATAGAAITAGVKSLAGQDQKLPAAPSNATEPFAPVVTPDLAKLPYKLVDGVKEFNLIAEVIQTELIPGRAMTAWGYNGSVPGPSIEVQEGDRVRIIVDNRLPEPTSMHWHGLEVPFEMDGVPGVVQDPILPGGTFTYEFTLEQNGTFFYHSHMAMQEMLGMIGLFIVHPKQAHAPKVDRDFGIILQEFALKPNNAVPNTLAMEYNWLTMNGKSGPATTPMIVKVGERVRIRLVNLGMDHHPIHLHGTQFVVTGSEGGRAPETTWAPGNTVLVGVAQAKDIEFVMKKPGDWMMHCHMPHHGMNQMVSMVGPISGMEYPKDDPAKKQVPGYPQDMWMVMDEPFKGKPETLGLRPTWTAGMMGMMTLVRALPPEQFDRIMAAKVQPTAPAASPGHTLVGRVEVIGANRLTVNHSKVEGWMDAMTMAYPVDTPSVLSSLKVGDQISATVFDGDMTLHNIKVVQAGNK